MKPWSYNYKGIINNTPRKKIPVSLVWLTILIIVCTAAIKAWSSGQGCPLWVSLGVSAAAATAQGPNQAPHAPAPALAAGEESRRQRPSDAAAAPRCCRRAPLRRARRPPREGSAAAAAPAPERSPASGRAPARWHRRCPRGAREGGRRRRWRRWTGSARRHRALGLPTAPGGRVSRAANC